MVMEEKVVDEVAEDEVAVDEVVEDVVVGDAVGLVQQLVENSWPNNSLIVYRHVLLPSAPLILFKRIPTIFALCVILVLISHLKHKPVHSTFLSYFLTIV